MDANKFQSFDEYYVFVKMLKMAERVLSNLAYYSNDRKKYIRAFKATYNSFHNQEKEASKILYGTGQWRLSRLIAVYAPKFVFPYRPLSEKRMVRLRSIEDSEKKLFLEFLESFVAGAKEFTLNEMLLEWPRLTRCTRNRVEKNRMYLVGRRFRCHTIAKDVLWDLVQMLNTVACVAKWREKDMAPDGTISHMRF